MPTYNVEAYIAKAIESILAQSAEDWELIVVDDGTKDRSAEIAQRFADKDIRIRVVHKENGGLSSARNFGLQFATGKYVTFFDPDDYAEPYFLSSLLEPVFRNSDLVSRNSSVVRHESGDVRYETRDMRPLNYQISNLSTKKNDPDVIIGGYIVKYESGNARYETRDVRPLKSQISNLSTQISERSEAISNLKSKTTIHKPLQFVNYAWNKLFRREFLLEHNLTYEEGLYRIEDAEFMSRLVKHHPTVAFVKNCGYVYVQRPVNTLSNVFDDTIIAHAVRRIGIDVEVLSFFNQLNKEEQTELRRHLQQSSASALLSRIYQQKSLSKKKRHELLKEVRNRQLPSSLKREGKSLKDNLKFIALKSLQKGHYPLVDFIYRFS